MAFCYNCGKNLEGFYQFCPYCGTPSAQQQAPVTAGAPALVEDPNRVSGGTKAKGFVGMGLGIGGLVFAALGVLLVLINTRISGSMSLFFSIYMSIFSMPLSIVGRILSSRSQQEGNHSSFCTAGLTTGTIGVVLTCVTLFMGVLFQIANI